MTHLSSFEPVTTRLSCTRLSCRQPCSTRTCMSQQRTHLHLLTSMTAATQVMIRCRCDVRRRGRCRCAHLPHRGHGHAIPLAVHAQLLERHNLPRGPVPRLVHDAVRALPHSAYLLVVMHRVRDRQRRQLVLCCGWRCLGVHAGALSASKQAVTHEHGETMQHAGQVMHKPH